MYKFIVALCLSSAVAFQAPVALRSSSVSTSAKPFENEVGVQAPLGLWDPLGLIADGDQERFERLRYIELKHGRIAQLAVLGQITTKAGIHFPGYIDRANTIKFADIPTGFGALSKIPVGGYIQIFLFIFALEIGVMGAPLNGAAEPEHIGDFRNGTPDFGWDKFSEETKLRKRAIELNQGRAAQMGILALMVHELLGNSLWPGGV